jgi:hypothetical protein
MLPHVIGKIHDLPSFLSYAEGHLYKIEFQDLFSQVCRDIHPKKATEIA